MDEKLYTKAIAEDLGEEKLFVASSDVEDRAGEIINQDGWDLTNYKKNPVVMWAHNYDEPPIGLAEKLGFKTIDGKKKLVYQPVLHRKTPMSNYIADLVDAGIIKATSVGFKPIEMEENTYTKTELLELSLVGVPMNQGALAMGISKGYSQDVIKKVLPDADFKDLKKEEKMEVEDKKAVIGYKKYPLSTSDTWDSAAEVREADVDDLKKMSTWYDSEKPELKSSYKLPHHTLSGYKTVWNGVAAAMAALMGARGGVNIPDVDKRGVYNHLAKHYQDFDKEAPELKTANEIIDKYIENRGADEKIIDLVKIVNDFIGDLRSEDETKKEIAELNTGSFEKEIKKRFEDIELNIQGLQEGFKPGEDGLEQRLMNVESSVEQIAKDIRTYLTSQPQGKGVVGREPKTVVESKKDINGRLALKVLNRAVEVLNKTNN